MTYGVFQRPVHEVVTSTESNGSIASSSVQSQHDVTVHAAVERAAKTHWKPIDRLQTVRQIPATCAQEPNQHHYNV